MFFVHFFVMSDIMYIAKRFVIVNDIFIILLEL